MKNMTKNDARQEKLNHFQKNISLQVVKDNIVGYFENIPLNALCVLKVLVEYASTHKRVWVSQDKIAQKLSISRKTVNKWVGWLQGQGLIRAFNRPQKTCYYYFSTLFLDPEYRDKLRIFFKKLPMIQFSISMLLLSGQTLKTPYIPGFFSEGLHYFSLRSYIYINQKRARKKEKELLRLLNVPAPKLFDFDGWLSEGPSLKQKFKKEKTEQALPESVVISLQQVAKSASQQPCRGKSVDVSGLSVSVFLRKKEMRECKSMYIDLKGHSIDGVSFSGKTIKGADRLSHNKKIVDKVSSKQGRSMKIPEYLGEIKSINLTAYGCICLSAYPEEVIKAIDEQLYTSKAKSKDNLFGWFAQSCRQYCQERDIKPDWSLEMRLKGHYNTSNELPRLKDTQINHPPKVSCSSYSDPLVKDKIKAQIKKIKELKALYG